MNIQIDMQYLDGNSPDGFDNDGWIAALTASYTEIASVFYPGADIEVTVDRQRRNSGCCRPVQVYADESTSALRDALQHHGLDPQDYFLDDEVQS